MKIKKSDLINVLTALQPGISANDVSGCTDLILFDTVSAIAYNEKCLVIKPFKTDFSAAIKFADFFQIVQKFDANEFDLTADKKSIVLRDKTTIAKLTLLKSFVALDEIRELDKMFQKQKWNTLPADFLLGAQLCMFSASQDVSDGTYTAIHVVEDNIFSTDFYRVSWYKMPEPLKTFYLKASCVSDLARFSICKYTVTDNWVVFKAEDGTMIGFVQILPSAQADFDFVEMFKDVDKKKRKASPVYLPENTRQAIMFSSLLLADKPPIERFITLKLDAKTLTCQVRSDKGYIRKSVSSDAEVSGMPAEILINSDFILQILHIIDTMYIFTEENRVYFESDRFKHLFSLKEEDAANPDEEK